jgi:hypothetical protein
MSSKSARSNTWTALDEKGDNKLTYWPQVSPSPLTVSLPNKSPNIGSLEIVIVNSTSLDIEVKGVEFLIPIGGDGDVLTSTTSGILTAVSDSTHWKIISPNGIITSGKATYELVPKEDGTSVMIPKGGSVAIQIFGFTTNTTPGSPTIEIKEHTASGRATTSFTVTIFPWGFAFSDLVANVRDGDVLIPVAQVKREDNKPIILTWLSSVVDTDKYTVYYSTNEGQQSAPVTTPGEWTCPVPLTVDTLFMLVVSLKNSVGDPLHASMSIAVAVTQPDLVAKSVTAQTAAAGSATVTNALTVGGELSAGSLTASGLRVGGSVPPSNNAVINVPLTIANKLQMLQEPQLLTANKTYSSPTDGLVIGTGTAPLVNQNAGLVSLAWITASSNGMTTWATIGNTSGNGFLYVNNESFILPVKAGASFSVNAILPNGITLQLTPKYQFWFVPLGVGPATAATVIGEAPPPDFAPGALYRKNPEWEVVRAMGEILLEGDTPQRKEKLAKLLAEHLPRDENSEGE